MVGSNFGRIYQSFLKKIQVGLSSKHLALFILIDVAFATRSWAVLWNRLINLNILNCM
jgi:hypothetical protein